MKEDRISVLAVDDELLIRQELEMFPWEEYGYLLVGTAGSGREALKFCREKAPDIVVTDITMPAMSGLELIRELGSRYPEIKTLILTCHEDFGYVKEAIRLGAVDYILKLDLSEKPMLDALEKAGKLVREARSRKRKWEDETRDKIGGLLLPGKDGKEIPLLQIKKLLEEICFPVKYFQSNYFLMIENRMESWVFVRVVFQEIFHGQQTVKNWFVFDDNCYAISFEQEGKAAAEVFIAYLNSIIEDRFPFMKQHFDFYVVKARPVRNLEEYCAAVGRTLLWRNAHFYAPDSIYMEEEMLPAGRSATEEDFALLERIGTDEDGTDLAAHFSDIAPMRLKEMLIRLMQKKNVDMKSWYDEVMAAENVQRLEALCRKVLGENEEQDYRYEIRQAVKLIRTEYARNLTLAGVAERVHLSPQYLSRLFGETVGKSFNDFITDVRMENARRLIGENAYRVYEVAEMVGIPNYRYFSTVFKKYYGVSPREMAAGKRKDDE